MQALTDLQTALPALADRDRAFALSLLQQGARRDLTPKQMVWVAKLVERASAPQAPQAAPVGDIAPILALIERARSRLKWPAILLGTAEVTLRLSIAGPGSRHPGTINVTDTVRDEATGRRAWFGRITQAGFEASPTLDAAHKDAVTAMLVAFAADPVAEAAAYGHRTGHCCFCNTRLDDERSTDMGYGPICARNYGLPWGNRRCEAV